MPPMPEPMETPIRSAFSSVTSKPESLKASIPAAKPYWINVSIRLASLAEIKSSALKSLTSPAMVEEKAVVSNLVIFEIPDFPATRLVQAVFTPIPTGDTTPRPVITTRRLFAGLDIRMCS